MGFANGARGQDATDEASPHIDDTVVLANEERSSWFTHNVQQPVELLYQRYFIELLLRQKPLPPSLNGRHVPLHVLASHGLIDERRGHGYISNTIRSSRYTVWDFLPKQLAFQLSRLHNAFFVCIGVPQTIPGLSTTGNYTTILPLAFFILLTVIKEGYDDFRRHKMDKVENNSWAKVLWRKEDVYNAQSSKRSLAWMRGVIMNISLTPWTKKKPTTAVEEKELDVDDQLVWHGTKWQDIKVGDVIKLKRDDAVPADIVLLYADGENGVAYVETMALDGETNLKTKQAHPYLAEHCSRLGDLKDCRADFVLEDPNKDLYNFNGKVSFDGKTLPLTPAEVILRGSVLRNTGSAVGLVVNTGEECKIRMNANHHPKAKRPRLERYANQVVITLIMYVIILSVGCSGGYILWHDRFEKHAWYIRDAPPAFKQILVGFLIMFNNIIPLALYVSLEIVKIGQMLMVQSDAEMYHEDSNTTMTCNTNTILENLGQVSYVLSDKTGTLTSNIMKFRGMSLGGVVWMHEADQSDNIAKPHSQKEDLKMSMDHQEKASQHDTTGIVVQELEVAETRSRDMSEPRLSGVTRRSYSRPRLPETQRTTADLLNILRRDPHSVTGRKAREFILSLAICHTALPEEKDGKLDFQASSPDELALVRAAQDLGFLLCKRSSQTIELRVPTMDGGHKTETYDILDVIEFSSKRKRMSIVVRCPDNRIWLICKGADSAIIPRLRQSDLASRKSREVRRSMDIERTMQRKSEQVEPKNSFGGRPSLQVRGRSSMDIRRSLGISRATLDVPLPGFAIRNSLQDDLARVEGADDSTLFTRCFKHIDDFATEGLRTLLFAQKYSEPEEYQVWKKAYQEATTSLVQRQERIEEAAEMIEQGFDLLGASAIEDKLQEGVPETIDRLRRANIRIWMLTGDKRETAINIAHSARICQPASLIYILDATKGDLHGQMSEVVHDADAHRVVVIDGHTLEVATAQPGELRRLFFTLIIANADSVIVCRASPSQKAEIVKGIRERLPGLTLAIGDGANDISMIQAAHVGVGISGLEGLQAARVADFSIAQFRFLQRLLLVHGRYQYVRTARFILLTFWKEGFFYMQQALYQRYNGYTGTSLYESWSLTVLNTLFTSLCVIVPGIFEQDLRPATLLAVPELYTFGQRNLGLNFKMFIVWMIHAAASGIVVWFIVWVSYGHFNVMGDNGLFALGDLAFSMGIIWTNWKIFMIETHYKTIIVMVSFLITVGGWFAWNGFMSGIYSNNLSPYDVKGGFSKIFGTEWVWWLTLIIATAVLATAELVYGAIKRNLIAARAWPPWKLLPARRSRGQDVMAEDMEVELWQEMERDPVIRKRLETMAEGIDSTEEDEAIVRLE